MFFGNDRFGSAPFGTAGENHKTMVPADCKHVFSSSTAGLATKDTIAADASIQYISSSTPSLVQSGFMAGQKTQQAITSTEASLVQANVLVADSATQAMTSEIAILGPSKVSESAAFLVKRVPSRYAVRTGSKSFLV